MNAFTARTPAQRASVALELLAHTTTGEMWRNFDNCFEMNDGDQVVAAGLEKLATSARYREAVRRWGGVTIWREWVQRYDNPEAFTTDDRAVIVRALLGEDSEPIARLLSAYDAERRIG